MRFVTQEPAITYTKVEDRGLEPLTSCMPFSPYQVYHAFSQCFWLPRLATISTYVVVKMGFVVSG